MITRIILLLIGYLFGIIETGYLYGKKKGIDIRTKGSGNVGATNTLRVFGIKAATLILLCDFLKGFIPCILTSVVFSNDPNRFIYVLYTGLGTSLGHNFPFYLKFNGGKGVAVTAAVAFAIDWKLGLILVVLFALIALITKLVSLSSIIASLAFIILNLIIVDISLEYDILCTLLGALVIIRHSANIERLLNGKENKIKL